MTSGSDKAASSEGGKAPAKGVARLALRALDGLAELTLVPSYCAPGFHIRRRLWPDAELAGDLRGKVYVVTGANSGIGFATSRGLVRRGARVIMVCRSPDRGESARRALAEDEDGAAAGGELALELADLSLQREVRALAERLLERTSEGLDGLINNAGVLLDEKRVTNEGHELAFATNVLAGHALTARLRPALERRGGRVIHVSSGGMYGARLSLRALQGEVDEYDGVAAYAQTKRAQVILNELWAERFEAEGSTVRTEAMHPGWVATPGVASSLPRFNRLLQPLLRDSEQGADTVLWLAIGARPGERGGRFWFDRRPRRTHLWPGTRERVEDRAALWALCQRLCDLEEHDTAEGEEASAKDRPTDPAAGS